MTKTTELINLKFDNLQKKNKLFAAGFVLFKSTLGIGLILSPQYFIKGGLILSAILTFFITFIITYGIYLVAQVSNQIERDNKYKIKIKNFDDICLRVGGKTLKYITQLSNLGFNLIIFYVNTINGANYWQDIYKETKSYFHNTTDTKDHHYIIVFLWLIVYLVLIILIKEPENLKFTSIISGLVLLLLVIILWFKNFIFTFSQTTSYNFVYFDFSQFNFFFGNMLYALESVGTIYTVRMGMRNPKRLPNLILTVFISAFFLLFLTGSTFMLAFGNENIKISSFDYYKGNILVFIFKLLFYLTLPIVIVLYVISNMGIIEELSFYKKYSKYTDKWVVKCTIRIIYMLITIFPIFFIKNEGPIMIIGGCVFCPILGFIVPIVIDYIYNRKTMSKLKMYFNFILLGASLILNFYCLVKNLMN